MIHFPGMVCFSEHGTCRSLYLYIYLPITRLHKAFSLQCRFMYHMMHITLMTWQTATAMDVNLSQHKYTPVNHRECDPQSSTIWTLQLKRWNCSVSVE